MINIINSSDKYTYVNGLSGAEGVLQWCGIGDKSIVLLYGCPKEYFEKASVISENVNILVDTWEDINIPDELNTERSTASIYIRDIPEELKFDYILIWAAFHVEDKNRLIGTLKIMKERLNTDGSLYIMADNRLGSRYICGAKDRNTGVPMSAVNRYPHGTVYKDLARYEWEEAINEAGYLKTDFFYVLPCSELPQMILNDCSINNTEVIRWVDFNVDGAEKKHIEENSFCYNLADNGIMQAMANSYLIQCKITDISVHKPDIYMLGKGADKCGKDITDKIYQNARKIVPLEFIPPATGVLKDIQAVEYDLLERLIEICNQNNLVYYAIYGTLLGAVRHQGIINWDDDMDIALPRKDYDQFIRIAHQELQFPYYLQVQEYDDSYFCGGYAKLQNLNTTAITYQNWINKNNSGIWIDIFPLDEFDENEIRRQKQFEQLRQTQKLLYAKTFRKTGKPLRGIEKKQWDLLRMKARWISHKKLCDELYERLTEGSRYDTQWMGVLARYYETCSYAAFHKSYFGEGRMVPFGKLKIRIPNRAEDILSALYGDDYMAMPPKERRQSHHTVAFDPYLPFEKKYSSLDGGQMFGDTMNLDMDE